MGQRHPIIVRGYRLADLERFNSPGCWFPSAPHQGHGATCSGCKDFESFGFDRAPGLEPGAPLARTARFSSSADLDAGSSTRATTARVTVGHDLDPE